MNLNFFIAVALILVSHAAHSQNVNNVYMKCDVKVTQWMNDTFYGATNEQFDIEISNNKGDTSVSTSSSSVGSVISFDSRGFTKEYKKIASIKNYSSDSVMHFKYDELQNDGTFIGSTEFKINRFTGSLVIDFKGKVFKGNTIGDCKAFVKKLF
jgi:hypothetical protein